MKLIQEVDPKIVSTYTLSISKEPNPNSGYQPSKEEYQAMEFVPIGTQIGFNPNKLAKLWHALAGLALHVKVPESKKSEVCQYGDSDKIRAKVIEALEEIRRIDEGTLISSGSGEDISFVCPCGTKNKRKVGLLQDQQVISCINPTCKESFVYQIGDHSFGRRVFEILCRNCKMTKSVPKKMLESLGTDKNINYLCVGCDEKIILQWRPMQAQKTNPNIQ